MNKEGTFLRGNTQSTFRFLIFIDYPSQYSKRGKSVTIHIDGDGDMSCNLKIIKVGGRSIKMKVFQNKELLKAFHQSAKLHEYEISGQALIKIEW